MGTKDQHRHKVSPFNPAWCLSSHQGNNSSQHHRNNGNKSPLPTAYRPKKHHHRTRYSPELTIEPTSPRDGCMGQIRQCKSSSRAAGAAQYSSATSSSRSSSISPQFNLMMLEKGASSSVNTLSSSSSRSISATPSTIMTGEFSLLMLKRVSSTRALFEEMDPPRPAERKEAKPENSVSLWKRRCAGGGGGNGPRVQLQPMEHACV